MDFFRSQDIARRNTVRLVLLFVFALLSLIAITNLLLFFALGQFAQATGAPLLQQVDWKLIAWVSLAIVAVVAFGSLYKIISLAGGGARVAEMMQGRLLVTGSSDPAEQRILNVVEEMAIASGTPVPPVYLLEEAGINAFAAGYTPADAVIGITRGAIDTLSRDELQGVVAHEFSHILHGDMRLNIRLIGILHGITVLGMMGYYIVRSTRHSRRSKDSGNIAVIGIGLMVIGYAGTFFGSLIKAAVSRQREFLADASAVQYTRNPSGIADALKRIGGSVTGSVLENPGTAEISHTLFSNGIRKSFNSLFATHPPLDRRIRRIQPGWDGRFEVIERSAVTGESEKSTQDARASTAIAGLSVMVMTEALLAHAGNPQEADLQQAQALLASIPPALLTAAHNPFSARALIYLLLLDKDESVAQEQQRLLSQEADTAVLTALQTLKASELDIRPELRLALVSLSLTVLRQLSPAQYTAFRSNLQTLILSDGRTSLWEWVLQRVVLQRLDEVFQPRNAFHHKRHHSLSDVGAESAVLLAFLIRAGRQQIDEGAVFVQAVTSLGQPALPMPAVSDMSIERVNTALDVLSALRPLQKPAFLKACAVAVSADGNTTVPEMEIFRAIAAALDCPLPPLPLSEAGISA